MARNISGLKSWKPGQSGNPAGKKKGTLGLAGYIRSLTKDCREQADFMRAVMLNENEDTRNRLTAAQWLTDRGVGKAAEVIEFTDNTLRDDAAVAHLSEAEAWQLKALQAKARGEEFEHGEMIH